MHVALPRKNLFFFFVVRTCSMKSPKNYSQSYTLPKDFQFELTTSNVYVTIKMGARSATETKSYGGSRIENLPSTKNLFLRNWHYADRIVSQGLIVQPKKFRKNLSNCCHVSRRQFEKGARSKEVQKSKIMMLWHVLHNFAATPHLINNKPYFEKWTFFSFLNFGLQF